MTHLDVNADHSMMRPAEKITSLVALGFRYQMRPKEKIKMLIILFAGILLIGCANGDNQSTMVAPGSGAVFHAENEAKPLPMTARR
jgi:hypothetical protein